VKKELTLCDEGLHYTGLQVIDDVENHFYGGIEFIQSYPHIMLGHTTECVVIKKEDIPKVIDFLQKYI